MQLGETVSESAHHDQFPNRQHKSMILVHFVAQLLYRPMQLIGGIGECPVRRKIKSVSNAHKGGLWRGHGDPLGRFG